MRSNIRDYVAEEDVMNTPTRVSPWWRHAVILVLVLGFSVLIWQTARTYTDAPPIPDRVVDSAGALVFTGADIRAGQAVFLKYGLMDNGTIWGHGAYLGPDFSAAYLHTLALDAGEHLARDRYGRPPDMLTPAERATLEGTIPLILKTNRYDAQTRTLSLTAVEVASFQRQLTVWATYFSGPSMNGGLPPKYIADPAELRTLTAFFAWTAWAAFATRPGQSYSYTNNFPYDPLAGNGPTGPALLWSALSLIALLGGTALVLVAFGRFDFLGWKSTGGHVHPQLLPGQATDGQRATIKLFGVVALLFLLQVLVGGATAHYRAEPGGFYGMDLSALLPSNLFRTWHLQLAIFWIATAYVAGGLFLAPALAGREPRNQAAWTNVLFGTLVVVVLGSMGGEWLGLAQRLGDVWFWLGHQGWEYLELGRAWQVLLAAGLVLWLWLLFRTVRPARVEAEGGEVASLFLYAAVAIPVFYLPALFFGQASHFSVVDAWRFWIIHLWVEGFFELFVTVLVAVIFYKLGIITHLTAARVVYLDAILYLGGGIVGTGHHWYWTGQSVIPLALGATFSALEVVPLTLLTLDAWDFITVTRARCDVCHQAVALPHKWTFYFLIAVGVWNFLGAGVFGFLINLPIVSYYEVGTVLTPNHGHAAMMGVFGMLAVALMVFAFRQVLAEADWVRVERYVRISFWGLNGGLALMVATNLFPGGIVQLVDVLQHGYWHARSPAFLAQGLMHTLEWLRLPADAVFIGLGVLPLVAAAGLTCRAMSQRTLRPGA